MEAWSLNHWTTREASKGTSSEDGSMCPRRQRFSNNGHERWHRYNTTLLAFSQQCSVIMRAKRVKGKGLLAYKHGSCFSGSLPWRWSTEEGNSKPLQYSCLESPMNSMKRQKDMTLKGELLRRTGMPGCSPWGCTELDKTE